MNRILFDTLTFLNGFIAILLVVICAVAGWNMPAFSGVQLFGLLFGGGVGLVAAAMFCGALAYFALMERHMRSIAESYRGSAASAKVVARASGRQEPHL